MSDEKDKKSDSEFSRAMLGVKPLKHDEKAIFTKKRDKPPIKIENDNMPTTALPKTTRIDLLAEDSMHFARSGLQNKLLRQFKNGRVPIEAVLDLHGNTVDQAEQSLQLFITNCVQRKLRCVQVIHGKGYNSPNNQTTLKSYINLWLQEFPQILAFESCQPQHGGKGAVYVLLKTSFSNEQS